MKLNLLQGKQDGWKLFDLSGVHEDNRGYVLGLEDLAIAEATGNEMKHTIRSKSKRGVIRGLHFQHTPPMGKFITVLDGKVKLVLVELKDNGERGKSWAINVHDSEHLYLWVPFGYAFGYQCLSSSCLVEYRCTEEWNGEGEAGVHAFDPQLNISWEKPYEVILSKRDKNLPSLSEIVFYLDDYIYGNQ